jgi:TP901 family phage tail tape measure protein
MASRALATAFVNIVPGTKELDTYLKKGLPDDAGKAGGPAGDRLGGSMGQSFGSKFKSALGPIIATAAAAFGAMAIGSFLKDGVTGAEELNKALGEVVSLTGTTGEEAAKNFGDFKTTVQDVSREFGIAQAVLTDGLYNALSAGVPKDNALEFLQVASAASIAGVTDVNTAVDGISTVINAFGLETADAQAVADSLFTAVKGGKTTFEQLSASIFQIAPAASAAGVSMAETNAAVATLTAAGVPTSVATTQIRAALVGLQKPSAAMTGVFQKLGYESAQVAIEEEGLQFALNAVNDAAGGSNGKLQTLLGSTEAVGAVNVLAGTGAKKFAQELAAQAEAAGATQAALEVIDPQRALDRLRVAFDNMKIAVGDALLPVFANLADTLTPVIYTLAPVLAQVMTGLAPILTSIVELLPTMLESIMPIIPAFGTLMEALLVLIDAGLSIFVDLLSSLIPVFVDLMPYFEDLLNDVLLPIIPQVMALVDALLPLVVEIFEALLPILPELLPQLLDLLQKIIMPLVPVVLLLVEAFIPLIEMVLPILIGLIEFLIPIFQTVVEFLADRLVGAVEDFTGALETGKGFIDGFGTFFEDTFTGISDFFKGLINGMIGLFEGFVNGSIEGVNRLISALNTIQVSIPSTPFTSGFTFGVNLPLLSKINIPRLAEGGYVDSPTTALIGEAGPEVVTPLKDFERMMGLDGSGKTLNYYAAPNQSIDAEQALFTAMRRAKVVANW